MGEYSLFAPGISKYHSYGLITPIIAATIPFVIAPYFRRFEERHHIFAAIAIGATVMGISYVLMRYVPGLRDTHYTLNKAFLLGLLVSEIMAFTYPKGDLGERMISAPILIFFLFMYLLGVAEIEKAE
jgi:drug/metabolite transporter (DMT)-like permease